MIYNIPLTDLNNLINKLVPGDTVIITNGTYSNISLSINCQGTFDKRITIKAQTPGQVILNGTILLSLSGKYTTIANFVLKEGGVSNGVQIGGIGNRLTGFDISINESNGPIVLIKGLKNRVDHCYFHDFSNADVWLRLDRPNESLNYALIDHNIFRNRKKGTGNGFETIRLGTSHYSLSNSRSIIEQNFFDNCDGEIEIISNKSSENIIYRNTIFNCLGALTLRHGDRSIVANNSIDQINESQSSGLRIAAGKDHILFRNFIQNTNSQGAISLNSGNNSGIYNIPIERANILNNISVNCVSHYILGSNKFNVQPADCVMRNNIAYDSLSNPVFLNNSGIQDFYYADNQYYATNFGIIKNPTEKLLNPNIFNVNTIDKSQFGYNNKVGPLWDTQPESSEILVDLEKYYNNLLNLIILDISTSL